MSKPYKTLLTLDFETRWDSKEYTLSKMTTEEYIRDPRFKAFGCCIHEFGTDTPTRWIGHSHLKEIFAGIDWTTTAVLCQNSMFDCGILSFIYDVRPCFIFDTLSMARAVRGTAAGNSLAKMAEAYGLPPKGRAVHSTDGLPEISLAVEKELADYCKHDVFLCEEIFKRLVVDYPSKELRLISMTIKMFTEPRLVLDVPMLEKASEDEFDTLQEALAKAGVDEAELASNEMFADILRSYGIDPPMKISKQTGKPALALAKNDAHFQQLLNGDNEEIALLCDARVNVKSTQARTRAQRFLGIASRGALPIPLNYFATETGRYGGTQQVNMQNMKRGGFLRKSIMAPDGYVVGVGDLSQIEPRVIAWLADYDDLLSIFCAGGDPYATFGEQMFNIPGMTKDSHPVHRQSAKSAMLGASYGLGFSNFAQQLLVGFLGAPPVRYTLADARALGVTAAMAEKFADYAENMKRVAAIPHVCTDKELLVHCIAAKAIIDKYRGVAKPVVDFWELLVSRIEPSLIGGEEYNHKDVLLFRKNEIVMQSGLPLKYHNIRKVMVPKEGVQYHYDVGNKVEKLYGGRMANHCIAEGTRVFTARGWVPIEEVQTYDLVHDGDCFVKHGGVVCKGVQACGTIDGVYMTPEHEVLTNEGWKAASQNPRPYRPTFRYVGGAGYSAQGYRESVLELPLRLRQRMREEWERCNEGDEEGTHRKLRVQNTRVHIAEAQSARHDLYAYLDKLVQYACAVYKSGTRVVQELWWAGHNSLQTVGAVVCCVLQGHGRHIQVGAGIGAHGQQQGVLQNKLPLGNYTRAEHESAHNDTASGRSCTSSSYGDKSVNYLLSLKKWLACGQAGYTAKSRKQVFDIINCGPQNRFVVQGDIGPFVVHNCTQGTARIVMTDAMLRVEKRYPVVGTVHDELLALIPEEEAEEGLAWVLEQMTVEPKWMPGIPLNADGGYAKRYGEAKK